MQTVHFRTCIWIEDPYEPCIPKNICFKDLRIQCYHTESLIIDHDNSLNSALSFDGCVVQCPIEVSESINVSLQMYKCSIEPVLIDYPRCPLEIYWPNIGHHVEVVDCL